MSRTISPITPRNAKYLFLDVVRFSKRTAEPQVDIVYHLNRIVLEVLDAFGLGPTSEDCILLPTGDGMCIAILGKESLDIDLQIALALLEGIHNHNDTSSSSERLELSTKFEIRIGINENLDIVIRDINGNRNVAGAGINLCQRIMSLGDASQILVGSTVFDRLRTSGKYFDSFRSYSAEVKRERFGVHQFIGSGYVGLNSHVPDYFAVSEPKLTELAAHYFVQCIKHAPEIKELVKSAGLVGRNRIVVLLYLLAQDSLAVSHSTDLAPETGVRTYRYGEASFNEQFDYYQKQDAWVTNECCQLIVHLVLSPYREYMFSQGLYDLIFVTEKGEEKLKKEWPSLYDSVIAKWPEVLKRISS